MKQPSLYMEASHKGDFSPLTLRSSQCREGSIHKCHPGKGVLKLHESMEAGPHPQLSLAEGVRLPLELVWKQEHALVQQRRNRAEVCGWKGREGQAPLGSRSGWGRVREG